MDWNGFGPRFHSGAFDHPPDLGSQVRIPPSVRPQGRRPMISVHHVHGALWGSRHGSDTRDYPTTAGESCIGAVACLDSRGLEPLVPVDRQIRNQLCGAAPLNVRTGDKLTGRRASVEYASC